MDIKFQNGMLVISIPATPEEIAKAPKSGSGKNKLLASSHGYTTITGDGVPAGLRLSLNLIVPEAPAT